MIYSSRWHRLLFFFSCLSLLVGSAACGNTLSNTTSPTTVALSTKTPASTQKTSASTTSPTNRSGCPASGQGRAANMPGIALGNRQEIVFYRNADNSSTLKEFDVQHKTSSPIVRMNGETIHSAQISQNGQWVLMVADTSGVWALQLVRVDGQDVQTLYCAPAGQKLMAQWSPDQKQIIFSQSNAHQTHILLLNPLNGTLQLEYTDANGTDLAPITWLDNRRVYIGIINDGMVYEPANLYVLDTSKGANQHLSDLTEVMGIGDNQMSFDCSLDGKTAYFTISVEPPRADALQSVIYAQPALSGGFTHPIFTNHTLFVTAIRVINATTLMILSQNPDAPESATDGLYTVKTDGSSLKLLVHVSPVQLSFWELPASSQLHETFHASSQVPMWTFNAFSQYTWSNFSRNGEYYVNGLSYGSFNGGPLTAYGSVLWGDTLVGWTTK